MRISTETRLPFESLDPKGFERFCFALLSAEGHAQLRHWGDAGNEQGCDLVSVDAVGRRIVTQCKRVRSLGPSEAEKEVQKVLDHPPDPRPGVWALIATCALSRETEERVDARVGNTFETCFSGHTELDQRARRHPQLVELFFGSCHRDAPPLWWLSAAPRDWQWAEAFARDLRTCLRLINPRADVALGIPSDDVPWPEVPAGADVGLVVVSPEALAHGSLRQLWRDTLCQPYRYGDERKLLAIDFAPTPWPVWLQTCFERVPWPSAQESDCDAYRADLRHIASRYMGLDARDLPAPLEGVAPSTRLPVTLRQRLVEATAGFADKKHEYRALAGALGLDSRKALDDFQTAQERAAAALVLASGDDDPSAAALRVLDVIQDEFGDTQAGFEPFEALRGELQQYQASLPKERQTDLLGAWLEYVETSHRRLVPAMQREQELTLLDRVYVELQLTSTPQDRFTHQPPPCARARVDLGDTLSLHPAEGLPRHHSLEDLFALDPAQYPWVTRRWIIRGDPGSGKTTLLRHLAAKLAKAPGRSWIPLFQSLPLLLYNGKSLLANAEAVLQREGLGRVLDHAGEEGRLLVLLDGLDEVGPELRATAEQLIRGMAKHWPRTSIVVTTRPIGYRRFAGDFCELQLQPLDRGRRVEFLARWFGRDSSADDHDHAEAVLRDLDGPGFEELTGNPLYLTLMALLLEDGVSPSRNRCELYDQVFELLLEGKHKLSAHDKSFEKIQRPEFVRQTLRQLAESMTYDNCDAERSGKLEERLYRDELQDVRQELRKVHRWDGHVDRFLEDIAEKVGILGPHDGEDADWRFWHRTFKEALTAERMAQWPEVQLLEHARRVRGQESRWAEPFALVCGGVEDADALLRRLLEANRDLALRALPTAQNVSHDTVRDVLDLTEDWEARSKVYEQLPELVGDADRCLRLIERLRQGVRNGNDLYFLDHAAWRVGQMAEEFHDRAQQLRQRIYDDLPKVTEAALLRRWQRPNRERLDLWCHIPAGVGWVGSQHHEVDDEDQRELETPRHRVRIETDFWLSAVPVTNALYAAFDPGKPSHRCRGKGKHELANHPRVSITWYEAVSFCRWLAVQPGFEGSIATLPEEEVWEYACRAGSQTRYWTGDSAAHMADAGCYGEGLEGCTHPVGARLPNAFGLFDVHGNVWESTASAFEPGRYHGRGPEQPYALDPCTHPADLAADPHATRVMRGGSYWFSEDWCRSAFRFVDGPGNGFLNQDRGFRVLLSRPPS